MGTLNIAEWSPDQVAEWLSGLGPTVTSYVPSLREQGLDGAKLLTLRCDDLEYLGVHVIGHQELILEAVEHLRNFQYEISRECVQQLALRVSAAATSLARALRHHADARLETHSLADVARTVHAVKPLVCWLDRWSCSGAALAERKAALLKLSLEAATCAQRDRFAEQPARAVAAAAAAAAAVADYIIQDVSDPMILQTASLDTVTLKQGERPLGFEVLPSFCGHHQLANIRFGSPAHASGAVHEGDEIVQVGGRCVIGWSGPAVERACRAAGGELALRLRRRGAARAIHSLHTLHAPALHKPCRRRIIPPADLRLHRYELNVPRTPADGRWRTQAPDDSEPAATGGGALPPGGAAHAARPPPRDSAASSSDESEPLSPPASPTQLHLDSARMYPPKPRSATQRRHTVSCGSPLAKRHHHTIEQFWQELQQQRWSRRGHSPEGDDAALYRRDKAVSYSTGLELSPRPRTCLGVPPPRAQPPVPADPRPAVSRGKLDKSHSTPAYDLDAPPEPTLATQTIPESPTTPDSPTTSEKAGQIRDFKKSSSQIGEAIMHQRSKRTADERVGFIDEEGEDPKPELVETVNEALVAREPSCPLTSDTAPASLDERPLVIRYPKPRVADRWKTTEVPPEPPPRPPVSRFLSRELSRDSTRDPSPKELKDVRSKDLGIRQPLIQSPVREAPLEPAQLQRETVRSSRRASPPREVWEARAPGAQYPSLRAVPRPPAAQPAPLKPVRAVDGAQISVPLRHITKHDIRLVSRERRAMPPINGEAELPAGPAPPPDPMPCVGPTTPQSTPGKGIFPSSKTRSLKKKNSILAKRREVPARALAGRGAGGGVWQRVRARAAQQPRWARRHLLLAHNLLYAYRTPECSRADCMIYLAGCTVSAAAEVKSRAHAFKVYHTGSAFYFACDSRDATLAWIQLIHRATLLPSLAPNPMELSKQFSETDYSETESDESPEKRSEPRDRDKDKEKEKEKDKSKFGSLKKLTHRMQRSESQENVSHSSTSLDRKYLRFFSRNKTKEEPKPAKASPVRTAVSNLPKPINYIHASNPNLLDFEKSDFVTKPAIKAPKVAVTKPDSLVGLVTLEQFMLQKQEEERRQLYTNRVLMGVERDRNHNHRADRELQKRLERIVPDVIYGEVRSPSAGGRAGDGYEKIVYPEEREAKNDSWRDSLRRNDRVHSGAPPAAHAPPPADSWSGAGGGAGGGGGGGVSRLRLMFGGARRDLQRQEYPHLQCPPTFQPETYSLVRPPPRAPHAAPAAPSGSAAPEPHGPHAPRRRGATLTDPHTHAELRSTP